MLIRTFIGPLFYLLNIYHMRFLPFSFDLLIYFSHRPRWFTYKCYKALLSGSADENDLRKLVKAAKRANRHDLFEDVCRKFDPDINFISYPSSVEFYGEGYGDDSLNLYRKVVTDKNVLFEKILFNNSGDHLRFSFFEKFISNQLSVNTPKVLEEKVGKSLVIIFYEYVDELQFEKENNSALMLDELVCILKDFKNVTIPESLDDKYFAYDKQMIYRQGINELSRVLLQTQVLNFTIKSIEEAIYLKPVFSHGDLTNKNFSTGGWVWDWDRCGFYPVCFDLTWAVVNIAEYHNFEELMLENIRMIESVYGIQADTPNLIKNAAIFSLIFYCRKYKPVADDLLLIEAFEYLNYILRSDQGNAIGFVETMSSSVGD